MEIPSALSNLPVARQIDQIDWSKRAFLARAEGGSGKTTVIPAYEALLRKRQGKKGCIAVRLPTKAVAGFTVPFIRQAWAEYGIRVGNLNRDTPEGSTEEHLCKTAEVVFITDGSLQRLRGLQPVSTLYVDEAHYMTNISAELDLGLGKHDSLDLRLMSATVEPTRFLEYLGHGCGNYVLEGRTFPVRKHVIWGTDKVFDRRNTKELFHILDRAVKETIAANDSALVFLPTRELTEQVAERFAEQLPTNFVHGGINPAEAEKWVREHEGKPFLVTATTAASTGVTIAVGRVYICDEEISSLVEEGMGITSTGPIGSNSLLQMAFRAGRVRPGDAYLITCPEHRGDHGDPWDSVHPEPIVPPSEKETPYAIVLALAQRGLVKDEDIDILGRVRIEEIREARAWLQRTGCLDADGKPTKLGNRVSHFPMATREAHAILTAPTVKHQLALLAAFRLSPSAFHFIDRRGRQKLAGEQKPLPPLLPEGSVVYGSVPLSLARLMQVTLAVSKDGLFEWCKERCLMARPFYAARKDFLEAAEHILKNGAKSTFLGINLADPEFGLAMHRHLARHPLFREADIFEGGRWGEKTKLLDSTYAEAFGLSRDCRRCKHGNDHNPKCGRFDEDSHRKCPCDDDPGEWRRIHHIAQRKHIRRAVFTSCSLFFWDTGQTAMAQQPLFPQTQGENP